VPKIESFCRGSVHGRTLRTVEQGCESVRAVIARDGMYPEKAGAIFCAKWLDFREAAGHSNRAVVIPGVLPSTLRVSRAVQNCSRQFCFSTLFWTSTTARDGGSAGNAGAIPGERNSHAYSFITTEQGKQKRVKQIFRKLLQ
jgi:hypothetical protein